MGAGEHRDVLGPEISGPGLIGSALAGVRAGASALARSSSSYTMEEALDGRS